MRQEPAFVSYLTWRSSDPIAEADLDLLVVRLEEADAEVCLQQPTHEEPNALQPNPMIHVGPASPLSGRTVEIA